MIEFIDKIKSLRYNKNIIGECNMDSEKKLLKIAGVTYGILGAILLMVPTYGIFLIVSGIYFYAQSAESDETIYKNRIFHYIIATIGITNIIGFILVLIANINISSARKKRNGINAPPKIVYKRDKESKKIDLLIKLGVAMIFVSGLLFATTSWSFINDIVKAFGLIIFGLIFLGLSIFTEKKLQLYRSAYMYWLLSISLFLLTIVGVLFFGIFGPYLTYSGAGSNLAYAITFLTGSGFALATYYKFPKKYLLYVFCGGMIVAISYVLKHINLSSMTNVAIITFITMIMNLASRKQNVIHTFSKILSYVLFGFILVASPNHNMEGLAACFINIINLNYMTLMDRETDESILNVIISDILIGFGLIKYADIGEYIYLMVASVITTYTLMIFSNIIPTKSIAKKIHIGLYYFIMLTLFIMSFFEFELANKIAYIAIPTILLGINLIIKRGLFRVESWKLANVVQPLFLFLLWFGILKATSSSMTPIMMYAILSVVYCILYVIYKNETDKITLKIYTMIAIAVGLLCNTFSDDIPGNIIMIGSSFYLLLECFAFTKKENKGKISLIISDVLLLTSIYVPLVSKDILMIQSTASSLMYIVLIYCIAFILRSEPIKKVTYLYAVIPLSYLITNIDVDPNLELALSSLIQLYIVFLIIKFFTKTAMARNIILIIGIIVCCSSAFITQGVYTGIYIGIIGISLIIYGYKKEDAYPVFITGIILTIMNIVYYLKDVWKILPFWLYLLLGGLLIIGFVTYRELQKQKSNKSK